MRFTCNAVNPNSLSTAFPQIGQTRTHARARHPQEMLSNNSPGQAAFQSQAHGEGMHSVQQERAANADADRLSLILQAAADERLQPTDVRILIVLSDRDWATATRITRRDIAEAVNCCTAIVPAAIRRLIMCEYVSHWPLVGVTPPALTERRKKILSKTGGRCFYCGVDEFDRIHIDHATPISRGGSDALSNLLPACVDCNFEKRARTVEEYRHFLEASIGEPCHVLFFGEKGVGQ